MSEIKYVNIDDDRFWEILSDEAYVEGQQSVRIRDALKNISTSEKEIIRKHFFKVVNQLNGLMPIKFNGFGKTLITVEDVIKIVKEECEINE